MSKKTAVVWPTVSMERYLRTGREQIRGQNVGLCRQVKDKATSV